MSTVTETAEFDTKSAADADAEIRAILFRDADGKKLPGDAAKLLELSKPRGLNDGHRRDLANAIGEHRQKKASLPMADEIAAAERHAADLESTAKKLRDQLDAAETELRSAAIASMALYHRRTSAEERMREIEMANPLLWPSAGTGGTSPATDPVNLIPTYRPEVVPVDLPPRVTVSPERPVGIFGM